MSLGSQLAPHLPFLRRFGRALAGSQVEGDKFVRATLELISSDPARFPQEVDPRLGLYRLFLDLWRAEGERLPTSEGDREERIGNARLSPMVRNAREALLLTALEGFSTNDAAWLLDVSAESLDALVADALREIEQQTRTRVLIIEDEPIIAMDLESIVRDLGHEVTGVAISRREAVALAFEEPPGLVLADIQLADDSSGIDAVKDILARLKVPVIFITAYPERLLTGERPEPTFLITKPFKRATVKAAISQALFFNEGTVPATQEDGAQSLPAEDDATPPPTERSPHVEASRRLRALDPADLQPLPAPVDAAVVGGRLRRVTSTPVDARLGPDRIAALWRLHGTTAGRIAAELDGSNVGRAFVARMEAVRDALSATPNDNDALAIGVQSHGLVGMLPIVREALLDDVAADLEAFLTDLRQLAGHFSSYREFVGEAERAPALPPQQAAALAETARVLEAAPDDAVDPALKESIAKVRSDAEESPGPITRLAFLRTIGNVLKGLARYLRDLSMSTAKKFAEGTGDELGKLTFRLAKGGALYGLAQFNPAGLGWLLTLAAAAELLRDIGGEKKDD